MKRNLLSSALSFAHLAGLARPQSGKAEGDEPDDDDKEKGKGTAAEGDDTSDGDDKEQGKRAGAEGDDGSDDEDDQDDEQKGKRAKGKKAEGDDGDDEDDEDDDGEMRGNSAAAAARRRERARCAAIFASEHAAGKVELAATLAFTTTLSRSEAIAVLKSTPRGSRLADRMAQIPQPRPGAGGPGAPSGKQAAAASWDHAFKKTAAKR